MNKIDKKKLNISTSNYIRRYAVEAGFIYAAAMVAYFLLVVQWDSKDVAVSFRRCIPLALEWFFVSYLCKRSLFSVAFLPYWLVGLSWALITPISGYMLHDTEAKPIYDILFGFAVIPLLSGMSVLTILVRHKWPLKFFYSGISLFMGIVCLSELIHIALYGTYITEAAFYGILQTNIQEAWEYLLQYVHWYGLLGSVGVLAVFLAFVNSCNRRLSSNSLIQNSRQKLALTIILLILTGWTFGLQLGKTEVVSQWRNAYSYYKMEQAYQLHHPDAMSNLQINSSDLMTSKLQGTVIVVIGESASRNYMHAYNPQYEYDNTPWWDAQTTDPGFLTFDNGYSCYNQTVKALERTMTQMSQYNSVSLNDAVTIIDVANNTGYDTHWLTSQGGLGKDAGVITMMAGESDHYVINASTYDEALLPFLEDIDGSQNNFVVIHLIGSHSRYIERYPQDKAVWDPQEPEANYSNTLAYTDDVLRQIFEYGKEHLNMQVMVYFSDHGEDPYRGHHPSIKDFNQVRIPMFVYFSPAYRQAYPDKTATIRSHQHTPFSNDMIYNTICGIIGAESNKYDEKEDLSSTAYNFNQDTVMTMLGKVHINQDPYR